MASEQLSEMSSRSKECLYCKTANTPLWRVGPDGCKTLCNACGIRWKRTVTRSDKRSSEEDTVLAGASDEDQPSWDEISEVAAKLTLLAESSIGNLENSRKRKRDSANKANKRQEFDVTAVLQKIELLRQEQESTDAQLEVLHAHILRQNNERVAMANMVNQLYKQISMLEQAVLERNKTIEELETSVKLKKQVIASFATQGGWQM